MIKYLIKNHLSLIVDHLYLFGQLFRLPFPNLTEWFDEVNLFCLAFPATKKDFHSSRVAFDSLFRSRFKLYLILCTFCFLQIACW